MGQQVSVDTSHARKKLKREKEKSPIQVAKISDITNQIANYLSKEDLSSFHSTSKSQSDVVGKNMKYIKARCAEETVDGLACDTENMPLRCTNWCTNNSMRKLYSVFKMISQENGGATFKFDNPDEYAISGAKVYGSNNISIRLHDHMYTLLRYNGGMAFSETDTSYSYVTHFRVGDTFGRNVHVHSPEVIRSKFEMLASQPFSEWGEWEIIIPVSHKPDLHTLPYNEYKKSKQAGTLYFKGRSIQCKGEIIDVSKHGLRTINIYIASRP